MNRSLASSTIKESSTKTIPPAKSTQSEKSEHYGMEEKLEKKKLELREKRRVRSIIIGRVIRAILHLLLAIGLLVLVILALYIVWEMGTTSSVLSKAWKFHPLPVTYPFDRFAVSSNSEMCNELARILHVEGHSFLGVATAVMTCLHITEPNRRKVYDPGVAIFADM
ncbi:unnamed protein product [Angiostrongylus costaricensis]|uniref:Transmembrane protein n=1 Tax=Angiostrongylus costaricensis TaxID=334426 RepID=A0A158PKL0_ANGCS|nr:unnamed protein product [Angiostrongylus costaricensis]